MNLIQSYADAIAWLAARSGWTDPMLHMNAGLAVLLVAIVTTRRSLGDVAPLVLVVIAALANEAMDYLHHGSVMPDTATDLMQTVFWPAMLTAVARFNQSRTKGPDDGTEPVPAE